MSLRGACPYPPDSLVAVISSQGGFYSTFTCASEVRRLGLGSLPPCVNYRGRFTGWLLKEEFRGDRPSFKRVLESQVAWL